MKRIGIFILVSMLLLVGCKDTPQQVAGTYSYKLSGTYTLKTSTSSTEKVLPTERGTMDLIKQKGDTMLVILNPTTGTVATGTGVLENGTFYLLSLKRALTINEGKAEFGNIEDIINGDANLGDVDLGTSQSFSVDMTGDGKFYDGTLLMTLSLYGKELDGNNTIKSKDLTLWAKQNK